MANAQNGVEIFTPFCILVRHQKALKMREIITSFLFLFFLVISSSLFAQQWGLIEPGRTGNYRLSDEALLSAHVWVDSLKVLPGGDTLIYLNRVARLFFAGEYLQYGLTNQQQFLQRQVRKGADGGWRFEGDSATFVLFGGLPAGEGWLFDTTNQVTAMVMDEWEQATFGEADSVQVVLLSTGDTILLSREFGILRFPDFSQPGHFFELAGLDGTQYGEQVPKGPDFFQIEPGDVLFYQGGESFGPDPGTGMLHRGKYVLEEKNMEDDTLVLRFACTFRADYYSWEFHQFFYWGTWTEMRTFRIPPGHFSYAYKGQHVPIPAFSPEFTFQCIYYPYDSILYGVVDYFEAEDGSLMKGIGAGLDNEVYQPLLALSQGGDSLLGVSYWNSGVTEWDYRILYQQGPGLRLWHGWCFEISGGWELMGAIIAGDTLGEVFSDAFLFHTGVEEVISGMDVKVSPNPVSERVFLETPEGFQLADIRVFSVTGVETGRFAAGPGNQAELDMEGFPAGLYHILLIGEKGRSVAVKVVKE